MKASHLLIILSVGLIVLAVLLWLSGDAEQAIAALLTATGLGEASRRKGKAEARAEQVKAATAERAKLQKDLDAIATATATATAEIRREGDARRANPTAADVRSLERDYGRQK